MITWPLLRSMPRWHPAVGGQLERPGVRSVVRSLLAAGMRIRLRSACSAASAVEERHDLVERRDMAIGWYRPRSVRCLPRRGRPRRGPVRAPPRLCAWESACARRRGSSSPLRSLRASATSGAAIQWTMRICVRPCSVAKPGRHSRSWNAASATVVAPALSRRPSTLKKLCSVRMLTSSARWIQTLA